jgi:hypothetical protein
MAYSYHGTLETGYDRHREVPGLPYRREDVG